MCVSAVFRKSRNRGFGRTSMPRELGGSNGRGTNSEELFAAAYTSSFLGMPRLVAAREGMALPPCRDSAFKWDSGSLCRGCRAPRPTR